MARRMGVSLSTPHWGLWRIGGIASANAIRRRVIFDSKKFPKLPPEERLAVVAHELAHLRARHSLFASLILICGTAAAFILALANLGLPFLPTIVWFAFILLMIYYRRSSEYQADSIAAAFVPPESLISFLGRFGPPGRRYLRLAMALTHPSTKDRIARLRRLSSSA